MRTPRPDPRLLVVKETCRKNSHFLHVPRWSLCAVTHHSRQRCYRQCPARCGGEAIPSVCRPKTSWPTTTWTLIVVLSFLARFAGNTAAMAHCTHNGPTGANVRKFTVTTLTKNYTFWPGHF